MPLRPRYSLLTLLLLTAAVAGGIKFWRGPHWAELPYPPSQEEQAVLEQHWMLDNFTREYGATVIRYQFVREGQGIRWLLLEGHEFQRPVLITAPPRQLVNGYPWTLPLKNGWQPIVFWIGGVEVRPEEDSLYLLAEDGSIYRRLLSPEETLVTVLLDEIENLAVRGRIAEEIEKLHVKQATEAATK